MGSGAGSKERQTGESGAGAKDRGLFRCHATRDTSELLTQSPSALPPQARSSCRCRKGRALLFYPIVLLVFSRLGGTYSSYQLLASQCKCLPYRRLCHWGRDSLSSLPLCGMSVSGEEVGAAGRPVRYPGDSQSSPHTLMLDKVSRHPGEPLGVQPAHMLCEASAWPMTQSGHLGRRFGWQQPTVPVLQLFLHSDSSLLVYPTGYGFCRRVGLHHPVQI